MSRICPNLSNPIDRINFYEIRELLGEPFAFLVWDKNNGVPLDMELDSNNQEKKSELFDALEKTFGTRREAIIGRAFTLLPSFQKKHKDFNSKSIEEQVKIVQNFKGKDNKYSLKSLAKQKVKQKQVTAYKLSESDRDTMMTVTRENLASKRVIDNQRASTARERLDAYRWFTSSKLSETVGFVNAFRVINTDAPSFAQWTKSAITLFQGSDYTDLYHEAWHEFMERYLTAPEKSALYSLVRQRSEKVKINNKEYSYNELTNRQLDEVLAEEFRASMLAEKEAARKFNPKNEQRQVKGLFNRIKAFLNSLFKKNSEGQTVNSEGMEELDLFRNLYSNSLDEFTANDKNISNEVLYRSKDFSLRLENEDGSIEDIDITADYGREIFDAIDYYFGEELDARKQSFDFLNDLENKEATINSIYESIKYRFYDIAFDLQTRLDNETNPTVAEDIEDQFFYFLNVYQGWDQVVDIHKSHVKGNIFKDNPVLYDVDELADDNSEEDNTGGRGEQAWAEKSVDPLELADPEIRELIKMLPDVTNEVDESGTPIPRLSPKLGLPRIGNFNRNKNMIQNKLNGSRSYEEVYTKLEDLSKIAPQIKFLLTRLPKPGTMTPNQLAFKNKFMQFVSMPYLHAYHLKTEVAEVDGKSELKHTVFTLDNSAEAKILEYFDEQFQENTLPFQISPLTATEFVTFSPKSALIKYPTLGVDLDHFKFLRDAFGVDLIQEGTPFELKFDKRGNIDYARSSKYHNARKTKAVVEVARHAHKKIKLFNAITESGNEKLQNYIQKNIDRPFATFTSNIATPLQGVINKLSKDNPVYQLYNELFGKSVTVQKELKTVFNYVEDFYNIINSMSRLNDEGNLEYGVKEWNHATDFVNELNAVENVNDLEGNYAASGFQDVSIWRQRMFDTIGNRLSREDGSPMQLAMVEYSGLTISGKGKKTTNLTGDDKMLHDFLGWMKFGLVENLRPGAKSSAYATKLNSNYVYYPISEFDDMIDTENTSVVYSENFLAQLNNYLRYEVGRMYASRNKKDAKEVRASEFLLFKDILTEDVKKKIEDTIKNSNTPEEFEVNYRLLFRGPNNIKAELRNSYMDFFNNVAINYKSALTEALAEGDSSLLNEKFATFLPKPDGKPYTTDEVNKSILYFITNYYTHQVEFFHTIYGDISNFNVKTREFKDNNFLEVFKRLGSAISPGKQPIIDNQDLAVWNSEMSLKKGLESALIQSLSPEQLKEFGESLGYTKNFKYMQFKDVNTFNPTGDKVESEAFKSLFKEMQLENYAESLAIQDGTTLTKKNRQKYLDIAEEEIGQNIADLFDSNDKESDAQAYMNLDYARFYLNQIGEWSPAQEAAYKNEVKIFQLILEYRKATGEVKEQLKSQIEALKGESNQSPLPSLKLGFWGSPKEDETYVTLGKYSVNPLLPSALFGTDLEDLMVEMVTKKVDLTTFDSGSKMTIPVESIPLYVEKDGQIKTNEIPKENILTYPSRGLRRQQYIAPKFKGKATLSTQLVKLLFSNFYVNGEINPEFAKIQEKVDGLQDSFISLINTIVTTEKAKLFNALEAQFDQNGNLESFSTKAFQKWIFQEFDKKDVPSSVYSYFKNIDETSNRFTLPVEGSPQRSLIEGVITSAISKRLIRPKLSGEPYIQLASTGHSKKGTRNFRNATKQDLKNFGVNGLRDYRVENGKTQPADVKVAFQEKKHKGLLSLMWNGEKIETLENLNKALLDDAWVEEHSDKLSIVGVRIPVQGFNSMEYFRVREFLPTNAGPVIIVPPSLVTKSGSDFDIDKLFMYEPIIDNNGNLVESSVLDQMNQTEGMDNKVMSLGSKLARLKDLQKQMPEFDHHMELKNEIKTLKSVLKDLKSIEENPDEITDQNIKAIEQKIQVLQFGLKRLFKDSFQVGEEEIPNKYKKLMTFISNVQKASRELESSTKDAATNQLIKTISDVLSEPAIFKQFTKKNDSKILQGISDQYMQLRKNSKISSSNIFNPLSSVAIFVQNTIGKKSLGVDAKTNALHKLFQQVGLRFNNTTLDKKGAVVPSIHAYYNLPANRNKDGEIMLGGLYDTNNEHLISDIINEFINGHVDIEKEDWINAFNADRVRTPLILQMVLSGTPIHLALALVNQPSVQYFIRTTQRGKYKSALNKVYQSNDSVLGEMIEQLLEPLGIKPIKNTLGQVMFKPTLKELSRYTIFKAEVDKFSQTKSLADLKGTPYEVSLSTSRASLEKILKERDTDKIVAQIALLMQFAVVQEQNSQLRDLTSVIDFNTNTYRTISDFFNVGYKLIEARQNFNSDAVDNIISNSVVSPFNIAKTATQLTNKVFDFTSSATFQAYLNRYINKYGKFWTSDEKSKEVNSFTNNFILALLQNYAPEYYNQYGPNSKFFDSTKEGNYKLLYSELLAIKDPQISKFVRSNAILSQMKFIDVKGSNNLFYPATALNDKDPNTTSTMAAAFEEGYTFNQGDPKEAQKVRFFFEDLAEGIIMGQGFNIRYRSLQPFLPYNASAPLEELRDHLFKFEQLSPEEKASFMDTFFKKHAALNKPKTSPIRKTFPDFKMTLNSPQPQEEEDEDINNPVVSEDENGELESPFQGEVVEGITTVPTEDQVTVKSSANKLASLNSKIVAAETPETTETINIKGTIYTKDEVKVMTVSQLLKLGLTPSELDEINKKIC